MAVEDKDDMIGKVASVTKQFRVLSVINECNFKINQQTFDFGTRVHKTPFKEILPDFTEVKLGQVLIIYGNSLDIAGKGRVILNIKKEYRGRNCEV